MYVVNEIQKVKIIVHSQILQHGDLTYIQLWIFNTMIYMATYKIRIIQGPINVMLDVIQ